MEFGVYTFGDLVTDPHTGTTISAHTRMLQVLDLARKAEASGLDVIGVGEHHGEEFVNSATAIMLTAMASVTSSIRLTSAATLLSTADPVRTYQEFATADLISNGRIELMFGRGAYTDNFPLFGYELTDYDALFLEKLHLFQLLNSQDRVSWSGQFRPPLVDAPIAPRALQPQLPVCIGAVSPASVKRTAEMGYPISIPVLDGKLETYVELATIYKETWRTCGYNETEESISFYGHMYLSEKLEDTYSSFFPNYQNYRLPWTKNRLSRIEFDRLIAPDGALLVGTPEMVAEKISYLRLQTGAKRFVGQIDIGAQTEQIVHRSVELLGTNVRALVNEKCRF
jgi:alkanesulfonate monooxygenase SsuD/methylene tetrahydromethanopterin reductase-like flavin-dependent oxidoreductase (luciferase family)